MLHMALFHSFCGLVVFHCVCVCILIYIYIYVYIYTHLYHIFIHSFVIGHLGCICVLPVVNSTTVFTGVHVSFLIIVSVSSVAQLCPTLFDPMD